MKLYRTNGGLAIEEEGHYHLLAGITWDQCLQSDDLYQLLSELKGASRPVSADEWRRLTILKPIENQEVWASGVTYLRSRDARMQESEDGGDCYDRVYDADRPELFFKATPARTVGPGETLRMRRDSTWDVPEPELTLAINPNGQIQGYTIGNDMSSRSIEGQNPLYLPQAKTYEKCAALGPCLFVTNEPLSPETTISLEITRGGEIAFNGQIAISQIKRRFEDLVRYLFAECEFPNGCFLMTGTGIVPADDFTLQKGDQVSISIDGIGTLQNTIDQKD